MSRLVLVNGLPGSGKTTLAAALASDLGIPLYSKDRYKEMPWDAEGGPSRRQAPSASESSALGRSALAAMWGDIATEPGPAVVESFWFAPRDREYVAYDLLAAGKAATVELWCKLDPAVARTRCADRDRHVVHHGAHADEELWRTWVAAAAPLALGPVVRVDTSGAVDVGAVALQLGGAVRRSVDQPEAGWLEGVLRAGELP